jgi:protein-disulfide isomerase
VPRTQAAPPVQAPKRRTESRGSTRLSRRAIYAIAVGAAVALAATLVAVSQLVGSSAERTASSRLTGVRATAGLLAGIPQEGTTLGRAHAPVTLVEYADIQCPYCGQFAREVLPTLVRRYVRKGDVRLEFQGLARVGPDSYTALRSVTAAGEQNRLWNMLDLLYRNQGPENSGWVTPQLLQDASLAAGAEPSRVARDATSSAIANRIDAVERQASAAGIDSTPTFAIGRTGGRLHYLPFSSYDPREFGRPIEQLLAR